MRTLSAVARWAAGVLLGGVWICAWAQSTAVVSGTARETGSFGYDETIAFSCTGTPTCTGTYTITVRWENCPSFVTHSGPFTVTGLNLAASGPIQGTVTLLNLADQSSCTIQPSSGSETLTYTGTWNLATGTASGTFSGSDDGGPFSFPFTFTATVDAPPPVFGMTVSSNINPVTATASAQIEFRPQDVGTTGSVFVFAYAPRSKVTGLSADKAGDGSMVDSDCVIAQVSPSGQLTAISASQMQAFFSGTLSSQGAAVQILNNASTPAVAGATFYVGYAQTAGAMLDQGIFRDAVVIPGSGTCPLLPMQTALWWNPRESGWGLNLNHQGNTLFGTLFTYDANRAPLWLVMSGGAMQADGRSFKGDLFRTTGPAFNAQPFRPITAENVTKVGEMTVSITDANTASLTYTVNGAQVTKSIQRQVYGSRPSNCMPVAGSRATSTNYQDLWWNAAESGWGLNIAHQDNTLFGTLFTYDASGRDLWLVMSGGTRQSDGSYLGDLYRITGSAFNAVPFTPVQPGDVATVGTMRLRFTDGERGEVTYTYSGATVTKQITRQVFASPAFGCT